MGKISDALKKANKGESHREEDSPETGLEKEIQEESLTKAIPSTPPGPLSTEANRYVAATPSSMDEKWDERLSKAVNEDLYLPEIFKVLRSRILLAREGARVPRTIMITSVAPKEGKSFVCANLGISLAQGMDQYSLMVSCDLRRPSLSRLFGLDGSVGLVDHLRDQQELGGLIHKTSVEKLSILPSGRPPSNPAELLSSARMQTLVEELSQRYNDRIILFDSPPYQLAAESAVLVKLVDSVIVVVRQGGAPRHQVKKLVEQVGPERLLGVVFNAHTTSAVERALMKGYGNYAAQSYD